MRIGIDAREIGRRPTGVGRYLSGLLTTWAGDERSRAHEFLLYAAEPLNLALDARCFAARLAPGTGGTWWEQVTMPALARRDHLDVFFAPGYTAPLFRRLPVVVTIHDVSFLAHPEWFNAREGIRRRWITRHTATRARAVITVSEFSRRELIDRLGVAESRLHVIPHGITARAPSPAPAPRPPSVLYVGSIFNRRHVPDLIRAFAPITREQPTASLDIVGDDRSYPRQDIARAIAAEEVGDRIRWHRYLDDDELARLFARARVFAFLSEYEGFGLTPLESLCAGAPPVLLDTAVARESCGNAAMYVPPNDPGAVTQALRTLLFEKDARESLLAAAPAVLARYDWRRAGRETLALLERAGSA